MANTRFRALIIDDDELLANELARRLMGVRARSTRRDIEITVDVFTVEVVHESEKPVFSDRTTSKLLEIAGERYDYLIVDYSYASKEMQPVQWNEGSQAPAKLESNEHLLTLVDLRNHILESARNKSLADGRKAADFFNRRTPVLLRSFQHDRLHDKLGPYEARAEATMGVFPKTRRLDRLDGFSLIYGADAGLREELYHGSNNGRRLYRNAVTALTTQFFTSAIYRSLAARRRGSVVLASSNRISLLVIAIAALALVVQLLVGPMVAAAVANQWGTFAALAVVTLLGTYVGSFVLAWMSDRGAKLFLIDPDDRE